MKKLSKKILAAALSLIMVFGTVSVGGTGFMEMLDAFTVKASAATTYTSGDYSYTLDNLEQATLTAYSGTKTGSITIPSQIDGYDVVGLGNGLYTDCIGFTSVVIPENITTIGAYTFKNCTKLTSIDLGKVTKMGYNVFEGCTLLKTVTVPATLQGVNNYYNEYGIFTSSSVENIIFAEGTTAIYNYTSQYNTSLKTVTIPEGVTSIGNGAFEGCTALTSVSLPDSVTSIGNNAFKGCTGLKDIPGFAGVTSIGNSAFEGCTGLTAVVIPDCVETIGNCTFKNCTKLTSIDLGKVTKMGYNIFEGCTLLKTVTVPATLQGVNNYYGEYGIFTSSSVENIIFAEGTTAIYNYTSQYNTSLKTVTIPEGVTSIGNGAFEGCTALTSVSLPDSVTSIGNNAFKGCTGLKDIPGFAGVTSIGNSAFEGCTGLTAVVIPDCVETIGNCTFKNCTKLTSIDLGKVTKMGYNVFEGCTLLKTVTVPATLQGVNNYYGEYGIFTSSSVENIIFAEGTTAIYNYTSQYNTSLKTVTIPEGVTSIGNGAFEGCTALTSVSLPDSVTSIGNNAFKGCTGLKDIPGFAGVTSIGNSAFEGCTGLTAVVIPDCVETIGNCTFKNCTKLTSIDLGKVTKMGYNVFEGCTLLKTVTVPATLQGVNNYYGEYGIFTNSSVENIIFAEGTTAIYNYTSQYNTSLKTVTIPEGVTSIGNGAFEGCTALTSVSLPDSVTSIGNGAFEGCTGLTEVVIPGSVTSIGNYCFQNDTSLKEVSISNKVTSIGKNAFSGISALTLNVSLDSYATIYAIDNKIMFKVVDDEFRDDDTVFLNRSSSNYVSKTVGTVSTSGNADLSVNYAFKKSKSGYVSNIKINIRIPDGTELVANTLRDSGNNLLQYTEKDGVITVSVTEKSGTIKFSVLPTEVTDLLSYATIEYTYNNAKKTELIGVLSEEISVLSLNVADVTASSSVTVKGIAPAEADVALYVDGVFAKGVKANKAGDYQAEISLSKVSDGKEYIVTAKCADYGSEVKSRITYKENAPELKQLTIDYGNHSNGGETVIYPAGDTTPYISFNPNNTFTFKADIENPEELEKVYVTSTRNGVVKSIEAKYDESTGEYIATGYFDESNHSYVPGKIGVEYRLKTEDASITEDVDFDSIYDSMPDDYKDSEVKVVKNTATCKEAEIDLGSILGTAAETNIDLAINEYEGETGTNYISSTYGALTEANGWIDLMLNGEDSSKYKLYSKENSAEALTYIIKDISSSKIIEMVIESKATDSNYKTILDIENGLSDVSMFAGWAATYFKTEEAKKEREELDELIMSNVPISKQSEALEKSAELEKDKIDFILLTAAIPLLVTAVGVSGAPAIIFSGLLGTITATSSFFWDYRTSNILSCIADLKFAVDPSGYVYEGTEDNRLENVTATAYWIESDGSDTFFDNKPADTNYGTKWNAKEYSQANPLLTDIDGKYAWDVPEGWWRVKYEKEGYETVWSDWMPVPPPQTEVNICMTKIEDKKYTVTWNADGKTSSASYKAGETIVKPADPTKSGYTFKGWTPAVPSVMPEKDLTFTAVFEKDAANPSVADAVINVASSRSVDYKSKVTITATATGVPSGYILVMNVNGKEIKGSNTEVTYNAGTVTSDINYTVKVVDANGAVQKDASGNELSRSSSISCSGGFFAKIVAFFKGLFGLLPNVTVKP